MSLVNLMAAIIRTEFIHRYMVESEIMEDAKWRHFDCTVEGFDRKFDPKAAYCILYLGYPMA